MSLNTVVYRQGEMRWRRKKYTTSSLPSLTQGAFIKAGFMQGGGWPLWGDPCTAGGLFWREQQYHMWSQSKQNSCHHDIKCNQDPKHTTSTAIQNETCCSTYRTIGVCIVCSSTADFSTCTTGTVRVTKNPHKYRGNNRQVDKEKQLSHGKVTYSSKTGLLRVDVIYISYLLL